MNSIRFFFATREEYDFINVRLQTGNTPTNKPDIRTSNRDFRQIFPFKIIQKKLIGTEFIQIGNHTIEGR